MSSPAFVPLALDLGPSEILIILLIVLLLFGAKKLPELARGSGRALRIFKAETKGLMDDDEKLKTEEQRQIEAQRARDAAQRLDAPEQQPVTPPAPPVTPPVEQHRPDPEH